MSSPHSDDLVARWTPEVLDATFRTSPSPNGLGIVLRELPFGRVNGRQDFRGLHLGYPHYGQTLAIRGSWLTNSDFSHARLEHIRFHAARLKDCLFHHATLCYLSLNESSWLHQCDFAYASIDRSDLQPGTQLVGCLFERCTIRLLDATASRVEGCQFRGCKLRSISLRRCAVNAGVLRGNIDSLCLYADPTGSPESVVPKLSIACAAIDAIGLYGGIRIDGIDIKDRSFIPVRDWPRALPRILAWAAGLDPVDREHVQQLAYRLAGQTDQPDQLVRAASLGRLAEPLRVLLGP